MRHRGRTPALAVFLSLVASVLAWPAASSSEATVEGVPLRNPGFEEPVEGDVIPGWTTYPSSPAEGTAVQVTDAISASGSFSALLDDRSAQYSIGLRSDRLDATAGDTYRATAQVLVERTNVRGYVKFFDASGRELTPAATSLATEVGAWTTLTVEGRAPEGTAQAQVWLYSGVADTSRAYVDDVALERMPAEPPLDVALGQPEHLGDGVTQSMAMTASFGTGSDGGVEQYLGLTGSPASFAAVDPYTGERKFSEPIPGSDVIWAMTQGSDGNVYFSGTNDKKLYRYLPTERRIEVVGTNPSDAFVWDLGASNDGKIYGATYPNAKVYEYDIATDTFRDLGSMMDGEQYARGIEVTDQYLYVGIGVTKTLIRYDRSTGAKESIPVPVEGGAATISEIQAIGDRLFVQSGSVLHVLDATTHELLFSDRSDGRVSPRSPHDPDLVYFKDADEFLNTYDMSTDTVTRVAGVPALSATSMRTFDWLPATGTSGGPTLVGVSGFTETYLYDPGSGGLDVVTPDVPDQATSINSLSADGGRVYVGGYQRGMSIFDEATGEAVYRNTMFHQPEAIGHLDGVTYFGTYGGARMYRLDPDRPYEYSENGPGNPGLVLDIDEDQDRPFALHEAAGRLFIGTIPTYGQLGGAVTIVEEHRSADGTMRKLRSETYRDIVTDQGVTGLAYRDGLLYGSTTISGGLGIEPIAEEAKIFIFDVRTRRKVAEFTPELPGVDVPLKIIGELTFGPDGLLWGAADGTIFAIDPDTHEVVKSKEVYPTEFDSSLFRPIYLEWGPDDYLYTTLGRHLVVVDPETLRTNELARDVHVMTLGERGDVYYRLGSQLYRMSRTD